MASEERVAAANDLAERAVAVSARLGRLKLPFGVMVTPDAEGDPVVQTVQTGYMVVALAEMLATALEQGFVRMYEGDPPCVVGGPPPGAGGSMPRGGGREPGITMRRVEEGE